MEKEYTAKQAAEYADMYHSIMRAGVLAQKVQNKGYHPLFKKGVCTALAISLLDFYKTVPREFRVQEPIRKNIRSLIDLIPKDLVIPGFSQDMENLINESM
jgi:hypothetical protein